MVTRTRSSDPVRAVAPPPEGDGGNRDPALLVAELVAALEATLLVARHLWAALDSVAVGVGDDSAPRASGDLRPTCVRLPCRSALSCREAEVLGLLAAGRSNHQIAQALFLSPRTVQRHIANVYLKIGVHCRAEATAYALRHQLA